MSTKSPRFLQGVLLFTIGLSVDAARAVPPLEIEPIEGLTTVRHRAPSEFSVPKGSFLRFCQPIPEQLPMPFVSGSQAPMVLWENALATRQTGEAAFAECPMMEVGKYDVRVQIFGAQGRHWENQCTVNVVNIRPERISIRDFAPSVSPVILTEEMTNMETMEYFFGTSIADFVRLGPDLGNGSRTAKSRAILPRYRTSVDRPIAFDIRTNPAGFEPLMEARSSLATDQPFLASAGVSFASVGERTLLVGPVGREKTMEFEIYRTILTSHTSGVDIVPADQPITFTAITDPPGYEDEITWVSSTKYGSAKPITGKGPSFTTQFEGTWGNEADTGRFQWLGVKADNTVFNQDAKGPCPPFTDAFTTLDSDGGQPNQVVFGSSEVPAIPPDFFFFGSPPFVGTVALSGNNLAPTSFDMTDTLVTRSGRVDCPGAGLPRPCTNVALTVHDLSLIGPNPITVGGQSDWLVAMGLANSQPNGMLMPIIEFEGPDSGHYTVDLDVLPRFIFVRESDIAAFDSGSIDIATLQSRSRDLLPGPVPMDIVAPGVPWSRVPPLGFSCNPAPADDPPFYPGDDPIANVTAVMPGTPMMCSGAGCHGGPNHAHCTCTPPVPAGQCTYTRIGQFNLPGCTGACTAPAAGRTARVCKQLGNACTNGQCRPWIIAIFRCAAFGRCVGIYRCTGCT